MNRRPGSTGRTSEAAWTADQVEQPANSDRLGPDVADHKIVPAGPSELGGTGYPAPEIAVASPLAGGEPHLENSLRRRDQNDRHVGISPARSIDDGSRDIAHHGAAGADIILDGERDPVAVAMGLPPERESARRDRPIEGVAI